MLRAREPSTDMQLVNRLWSALRRLHRVASFVKGARTIAFLVRGTVAGRVMNASRSIRVGQAAA